MIKTCEFCNKEYEAKREAQRACSRQCNAKINVRDGIARLPRTKTKIFVCPKCGKEFERLLSTVKIAEPYCSRRCSKLGRPSLSDRRVARICARCGNLFLIKKSKAAQGRGIYCSKECTPPLSPQAARTHGHSYSPLYGAYQFARYRARKLGLIDTLTVGQLEWLFAEQAGRCDYCQIQMGQTYQLDHEIPLERGGDNTLENVHFVCRHCNNEKRTLTDEEYRVVLDFRKQKAAREERSA